MLINCTAYVKRVLCPLQTLAGIMPFDRVLSTYIRIFIALVLLIIADKLLAQGAKIYHDAFKMYYTFNARCAHLVIEPLIDAVMSVFCVVKMFGSTFVVEHHREVF